MLVGRGKLCGPLEVVQLPRVVGPLLGLPLLALLLIVSGQGRLPTLGLRLLLASAPPISEPAATGVEAAAGGRLNGSALRGKLKLLRQRQRLGLVIVLRLLLQLSIDQVLFHKLAILLSE